MMMERKKLQRSYLNFYGCIQKVTLSKLIILTRINHDKHSKTESMKLFWCTKYKIDQARKLKLEKCGIIIPQKVLVRAPGSETSTIID